MLNPEKVRHLVKTHYSDLFINSILESVERHQGHLKIAKGLRNHLGENTKSRQFTILSPVSRFISFNNKILVDLGCGTGSLTVACALRGANTIGVDIDRKDCQIAKLRAKEDFVGAQFIVADAKNLPFKRETFDICMCVEVIEHVSKDKEGIIYEAFRITRQQGLIEIETPNKLYIRDDHDTGLYFLNCLPKRVANCYAKLMGRMLINGLNSYVTLFFLKKVLQNYNCKILGDIVGYNFDQIKEIKYKKLTGRILVNFCKIPGLCMFIRLVRYFFPSLQLTILKKSDYSTT